MITWIVVLLFIGGFGWGGKRIGALRLAIILVGLIISAALGAKLGSVLRSPIVEAAKGNPLIIWLAPPLGVFLLAYIIVLMLAAGVHLKVAFYHKYKVPDERRVVWERMNASVGTAVGVAAGVAHFIVYGVLVYSLGYWTVQLESADHPLPVRLLNSARDSLQSSGFEKLVAAFDPAPDDFYHAADAVGLIYNNPTVIRRFTDYPGALSLVERPEFQALLLGTPTPSAPGAPPAPPANLQPSTSSGDANKETASQNQPGIGKLLANPKIRAIFQKKEIVAQISALDMKDLVEFLKTGKSPKYKEEKVLGRWDLFIPATLVQLKQRLPQIPLAELARLKKVMNTVMADVTLVVSPDSQVLVKGSLASATQLTDILSGKISGAATNAPGTKILAQGNWKKDGSNYVVVFKHEKGEQAEGMSVLTNDNLVTSFNSASMVFVRAD